MKEKKCCILGFEFKESKEVYVKIKQFFREFIEKEKVYTFLFNECGKFPYVCYQILSELKEEYKNIERVYCYQENMIYDNLCKFKQLASGLYEDFLCVMPFSYELKNKYYTHLRMIDESDFVILPKNEKCSKEIQLFTEYAKLLDKSISFLEL